MIQHVVGNLFDVKHGFIVHGCNAQGVMGSGVAAQVKFLYPGAYDVYKSSGHKIGTVSCDAPTRELIIINAVTQQYYGSDAGRLYTDYDKLAQCFREINNIVNGQPSIMRSVHFPLIGCDRGGGDWNVVSAIIDLELDDDICKVLWTLPKR